MDSSTSILILLIIALVGYYIYMYTDLLKNYRPMSLKEQYDFSLVDNSGNWFVNKYDQLMKH